MLSLNCYLERFHSRGQHLCKFMGTKEFFYIRRESNSHTNCLEHQFLLVSVRHVGAHPDEHQCGVSVQISINLGKHLFGYLVHEIFLWPESWRGSLHIYLLSFPRFWTLSIQRFWFLFRSILNGVTLKTSNMAAVSLFWNTNKAPVTSCENALFRFYSLVRPVLYFLLLLINTHDLFADICFFFTFYRPWVFPRWQYATLTSSSVPSYTNFLKLKL